MSRPIVFGPAARALFELSAPTAVSAGAGSGKTTALVELCLRLLDGSALGTPCAPAEIVAITFTEKAAEELGERLRGAIAARARDAQAAAPGSAAAQAWLERLHALDRMAVGTIHGFCGRLLREHALEAGLDPDFEIADEERASGWLAAAAQAAVVAALDAGRPEARVLAAGLGASGARGGLPVVVAGLVRERSTRGDAGPLRTVAADTVAAAAARDRLLALAESVVNASGAASSPAARVLVDAVAAALRALEPGDRRDPLSVAALGRLATLGEAARGRILKADGPLRELKDELAAAVEAFLPAAAHVLAAPQEAELAAIVADAEARYATRKAAARAVDFDDLLVRARDLLRRVDALRPELRGRVRALLVDEYQDVNPVQQELFDVLARPDPAGPGPVLVAVGDLKQSIYRFRGADVAVFARLVRAFEAGAGRVLHLSENHRCAPAVLDLVNEIFVRALQPPPGAPPRDDEIAFGDRDRLVPTRPEGARPACELLVDDGDGSAAARREREARAIAARIGAIVSGAAGVAVRERRPDGGEAPRRPRSGDVAILFRRLTQIAPYERALRAAGIPYRLARGGGFYQAPEVRDVGELLAALADPSDAVAWAALLRSPACAVSDGTLLLLAQVGLGRLAWMEEGTLAAEVEGRVSGSTTATATHPPSHSTSPDPNPNANPRAVPGPRVPWPVGPGPTATPTEPPSAIPAAEWSRLLRLLSTFRGLHALRDRLPVDALLARAVEALDLDAALLAGPDGERRAVNLDKALALAMRFAEDGGTAAAFATHLRTQAARPPREPEAELEAADAVALLSVHQAKGLEWPVVFVPDLGARARNDGRRALLDGEGRLCSMLYAPAREEFVETVAVRAARDADRRSAAAESRRLLYVALTRARDHLVLSGEASNGAETWRGLVEAALAERPDLARRVPVEDAATDAAGPPVDGTVRVEPAASEPAAAPVLARPPVVAALQVAVTDLAEYARCPRRHLYARVLGVPEPRALAATPAADDPGRATARGTLAHAMLAEADLGAPPLERRAQLAAAAARRGYDPGAAGVRKILAEVARFSESPGGRALALAAREGRVDREVPFLLRLDGDGPPSVYLVGAVDALVRERRGEGLTVVDYKYATPRPGSAERYRLQLLAYVLAAARAHPGAKVRARLQFLRGDHRAIDVTPGAAELDRFARTAPRLAREALEGGGEQAPAALGRDEARCRAEGCGYVGRCYGK
ncbi:UvrD-helicase domain-containing protein [Anaeromyxobacter oryzae]|uniref:DNA 3'-5' helicase n=1 Tax=Anaeromyxobacter oryzae TaxID=2918170 RepID=A0ABN6MN49_9BACT|nr:UvrD-helicase domain-containing protein [Anaeromyxobacter oryzae]BDG01771.1 nuclease/helicase [Anaeromyxobacter oryzae]